MTRTTRMAAPNPIPPPIRSTTQPSDMSTTTHRPDTALRSLGIPREGVPDNVDTAEPAAFSESTSHFAGPSKERSKRPLKLTPAQRERKRAIDREAQRSIRQKTKNYIAHLENLVREMETGGTNVNGGVGDQDDGSYLANTDREGRIRQMLRRSKEEVQRLRDIVAGVQRLVGGTLDSPADAGSKRLRSQGPSSMRQSFQIFPSVGVQDSGSHTHNCESVDSHNSETQSVLADFAPCPASEQHNFTEVSGPDYSPQMFSAPSHLTDTQVPVPQLGTSTGIRAVPDAPASEPSNAGKCSIEGELYYFSEREVNRVLARGQESFANQLLDEDILVRAVLHGWRDVQDRYVLDGGWQSLKAIDQIIFGESGVVERMAILWTMRTKLLYQAQDNLQSLALPALPPFLQRSPMEDSNALQRSPVIEHFVWPGFRTLLCNHGWKYINNRFADVFRRSFKFLWPYDISNLYAQDSQTRLYSISSEFRQRQMDLRSWTMRKDFFDGAHELYAAVPTYEPPLDRALDPMSAQGMLPTTETNLSHEQTHQRVAPMGRIEDQEVNGSPSQSTTTPSPHPTVAIQVSVPTPVTLSDGNLPVTVIPHSAEVEAWLGDPDMLPHYWSSGAGTTVGHGAPRWSGVSRGFV